MVVNLLTTLVYRGFKLMFSWSRPANHSIVSSNTASEDIIAVRNYVIVPVYRTVRNTMINNKH
ncbi:hypothetical protein C0J52_22644 [Blattella germanica]|nr:hypothetical protein C0J52_22644 [Blattella germanica]